MENYKILEGEVGWEITLSEMAGSDQYIINSYGGDVDAGFAIHDYLKQRNNSDVGVMGVCASSATLILLGAAKRWATKNSVFLIHNPWTVTAGDSKDMQKVASELQEVQNKILNLYEKELTVDRGLIEDLMFADKFIDASKALEIGLIHEIREDDSEKPEGETAKAMYFNLKKKKMSVKNVTKEELEAFEKQGNSLMDKIKNYLGNRVKAIVLKDSNGSELDFDVETEDQIAVGTSATVDGSAASGEYVMASGETYVFEDGVVAEIKPAEDEEGGEMEALKAENEALKAKIAESETASAESETTIQNLKAKVQDGEALKNELEKMQKAYSKPISNLSTPEGKEEKTEKSNKAFKSNKRIKI